MFLYFLEKGSKLIQLFSYEIFEIFMAIECDEFYSGDSRVGYELNFQRSGTFSRK
jgi:hypothetical protein